MGRFFKKSAPSHRIRRSFIHLEPSSWGAPSKRELWKFLTHHVCHPSQIFDYFEDRRSSYTSWEELINSLQVRFPESDDADQYALILRNKFSGIYVNSEEMYAPIYQREDGSKIYVSRLVGWCEPCSRPTDTNVDHFRHEDGNIRTGAKCRKCGNWSETPTPSDLRGLTTKEMLKHVKRYEKHVA